MSTTKSERRFVYRVDADDNIVFVNSDWESFAQENLASQLTSEAVCGRPLSGFVAGWETQHLYHVIIESARRDRRTIVIPFRCDGPGVRRFMELTVTPRPVGHVQFEGRVVREETRTTVRLLDPSACRNEEYVVMCGWCKRVDVSSDWLEVEEAVRRLALFNSTALPQITHGMCVDCEERMSHAIDEAG